MEAGKFFLYYSIVLQIILCMYLSNQKLEWPLLIGSFYVMLLFTYGLILEIKDPNTSLFMDEFKSSRAIREIGQIITSMTGLDLRRLSQVLTVNSCYNNGNIYQINNKL